MTNNNQEERQRDIDQIPVEIHREVLLKWWRGEKGSTERATYIRDLNTKNSGIAWTVVSNELTREIQAFKGLYGKGFSRSGRISASMR